MNLAGAEETPRRSAEASRTSSCSNDPVWTISAIIAKRDWVGRISVDGCNVGVVCSDGGCSLRGWNFLCNREAPNVVTEFSLNLSVY